MTRLADPVSQPNAHQRSHFVDPLSLSVRYTYTIHSASRHVQHCWKYLSPGHCCRLLFGGESSSFHAFPAVVVVVIIITLLIGSSQLAMQFLVTFNCSFVKTADGRHIGIWYVDDGTGNCVEWDETATDSFVKGAQSSLTIATVAGFGAAVLIAFEWLLCEICCAGCIEGLAFCCAWIVGGGVFSIYGKKRGMRTVHLFSWVEEEILFPFISLSAISQILFCFDYSGTSLCGDFENVDAQVTDQVTGADDGSGQCTWGTDATYMTVANIVFLACGILLCWYVPSHKYESSSLSSTDPRNLVIVPLQLTLFSLQCTSTGAHLQAIEMSEANSR